MSSTVTDCLIAQRRAELVALVTAAVAPAKVCGELPDVLAADLAVVVQWTGTRWDRVQWEHTFECIVIPQRTTAGAFYTARDTTAGQIMRQLIAARGLGRPSATTRDVLVGDTAIAGCAVVTITATDQPVTT